MMRVALLEAVIVRLVDDTREARSAVIVEQIGRHRLSFLPSELRDEAGQCLECGERLDLEAWEYLPCPGRRPSC